MYLYRYPRLGLTDALSVTLCVDNYVTWEVASAGPGKPVSMQCT